MSEASTDDKLKRFEQLYEAVRSQCLVQLTRVCENAEQVFQKIVDCEQGNKQEGGTPLLVARRLGNTSIVQFLVEQRNNSCTVHYTLPYQLSLSNISK